MVSRRGFLQTLVAAGVGASVPNRVSAAAIDRYALVSRHSPRLTKIDPLSPLSLGNGEFAFTADVTGLQTFPRVYERAMPLCTMSQWGWHTRPMPATITNRVLRPKLYETHGRKVGYHTSSEGQTELFHWLRENPHRLHLGQIGLCLTDRDIEPDDVSAIDQQLNLWRGILTSSFKLLGEPVSVTTAVHPTHDLLAVVLESRLIEQRGLAVRFAFPYGSPSMQAADWNAPEKHQTRIVKQDAREVILARQLDGDRYFVTVQWEPQAQFRNKDEHTFLLTGAGDRLEFLVGFSPRPLSAKLLSARTIFPETARNWQEFWTNGGAVELAQSKDKRAVELERRVILSQYLTAIQCSGSMPPQETGLTVNSWYGKFHLEMHWWHATHFALWNRLPLFERSLGWYQKILPAHFDQRRGRYVLGPPVIPAQENHPPEETWNPTFELAYWSYGLKVAQRWRERLGMPRNPEWDRVLLNLSPLPSDTVVYFAHENCPETFSKRNHDHPSMLGALGVLAGDGVDREIMRNTLRETMARWQWDKTWGWDYPMTAMTAARLGETKIAVDALLMTTEKNRYLTNGHNWQRDNLPCYLPGNGGLLYAIALMIGVKGFPQDGSWTIRSENINHRLHG